jgi:Holliday junction resolvase RusA-like endonuclease
LKNINIEASKLSKHSAATLRGKVAGTKRGGEEMTIMTTTDPPRTSRRKPKSPPETTTVDVTIPPSVNRLWRYSKAGRVYRSPAYEDWISEAGWELRTQRPKPVSSPVRIVLRAGLPDRPRDLDNVGKAALDLLQAHGLIRNDLDVVHLTLRWDRTVPAGRLLVELSRTTAP